MSWASSATASSMRCAPSRRAIRRRSGPRPRPSGPTPPWTRRPRSPSSAVGEALVSLLQDKGVPGIVERTMIRPPALADRTGRRRRSARQVIGSSPLAGRYDQTIDREFAYEVLKGKAAQQAAQASAPAAHAVGSGRRRPPPDDPRRQRRHRPPDRDRGPGQERRAQHRQPARPPDRARPARLAAAALSGAGVRP